MTDTPKITVDPIPRYCWGYSDINGPYTVKSKPGMKASPDGGGSRGIARQTNFQGDLDWEHMG